MTNTNENKARLFIVAAPSGAGKTSLVKELAASLNKIEISISHTTRQPRPAEKDAQDYYFVDEKTFIQMIEKKAFLEHASVFNHHYGTSYSEINKRLEKGIDVLLDIDWQGALQIKQHYPDAVGIFILPPSLEVLKERLHLRRQDNDQVIQGRMQAAQNELQHYKDFDYLIVNDQFSSALEDLKAIIIANRLSLARQACKFEELLGLLLR